MKILLDFFFPIVSIEPTPAASTASLKQVLVVAKPKSGATEDVITLATSLSGITSVTDNLEAGQLFAAGMSRVYIIVVDDLVTLGAKIAGREADFHTILISSDFSDAEMDAATFGLFTGVIGEASTNDAKNLERAVLPNRVAFHSTSTNKAKNMFYAFGKLLSNALNWTNNQYITMPFADDIDTLGEANNLFDSKINFVISDTEFGQRLGLFTAGGKAIVLPYIKRNLQIDLQSAALAYVTGNQPAYTLTQAALLEDELQKVIELYITRRWIDAGKVEIKLEQENFVASGYINISEPKALWRILGEMRQTL